MYFIKPVITDLAQTRVNEAINTNQPLIFTKLSIGKGKQEGDLKKVSSMKTHFMDLSIDKELQGETVKLFSRLSNESFVEEAHITELGVFARVGNIGTEFLFMYTCADQGDIIPPANNGAYIRTYRFETTLRSDGELTINVVAGEGVYVTLENLEEHTNDKSNPHNVTKEQIGLVNATDTVDGLMSKEDKFKLGTIENGAQINPTLATQTQAEAGTDNTTRMTPLRTKQAIEKLSTKIDISSNKSANNNTIMTSQQLKDYMKSTSTYPPNSSAIVDIPEATTNRAGLMSSNDKWGVSRFTGSTQMGGTVCLGDRSIDSLSGAVTLDKLDLLFQVYFSGLNPRLKLVGIREGIGRIKVNSTWAPSSGKQEFTVPLLGDSLIMSGEDVALIVSDGASNPASYYLLIISGDVTAGFGGTKITLSQINITSTRQPSYSSSTIPSGSYYILYAFGCRRNAGYEAALAMLKVLEMK